MNIDDKDKKTEKELNKFLKNQQNGEEENYECEGDECYIKTDKSIVRRENKRVITDDGRELLT